MALQSFFLGTFITYIPRIFLVIVVVLAALKYWRIGAIQKFGFKHLLIVALLIRVLYATFQTVAQYLTWKGGEFTQLFLTLPITSSEQTNSLFNFIPFFSATGGYFIFYVFSRFWLNILLSLAAAWLFWKFLKFLEKRNDRFFEEGETELGFLMAFIAGWPGFVAFIPLLFVGVALASMVRRVIWKLNYTSLGPAFIIAGALWLAFEPYFTRILGLNVLKI